MTALNDCANCDHYKNPQPNRHCAMFPVTPLTMCGMFVPMMVLPAMPDIAPVTDAWVLGDIASSVVEILANHSHTVVSTCAEVAGACASGAGDLAGGIADVAGEVISGIAGSL